MTDVNDAVVQAQIAQERLDHPLGGGKHSFTISVTMRGSGADYSMDLVPVTVQAFDLPAALRLAAKTTPLGGWFPAAADDDENRVCGIPDCGCDGT